jgi:hypothetical protein
MPYKECQLVETLVDMQIRETKAAVLGAIKDHSMWGVPV